MVSSSPCLLAFVEPVPCRAVTVSLTNALAALGQAANGTALAASHRLVLVDERHYPLGWVSTQQLLHCCAAAGLLDQGSEVRDDPLAVGHLAADPAIGDVVPSIIEPLVTIAADLAIDAFLPHLHLHAHACYALVDAEGRFLGLLDSLRLLQFLATRAAAPATPPAKPVERASTIAVPVAPLHPLLNPLLRELLEHLPLPVMLQTRNGQMLAQNSIWRTQIGELLDPGWLRHQVAALLDLPLIETAAETTVARPQSAEDNGWVPLESLPTSQSADPRSRSQPLTLEAHTATSATYALGEGDIPAAPPSASACQLGAKPGTCICVCPLKNGQEQVLQFVRIPLGATSAAVDFSVGDQSFELASLRSTIPGAFDPAAASRDRRPATNLAPASEELWLILAQDVTEQQQLARELTAKNADLIQLNRLKDEFLACISHELRTPLTAVLGLSSLLKDQTLGALNQRQVYYAQLIHQSGRHLMAVVNDILDLTRMETGQLELVLAPVELETVCRRAFEQAQQLRQVTVNQATTEPEIAIESPTFSLTIEPDLGLLIADEQRLRQMLVHLLSNALKFTAAPDPIGLKVNRWGGWIALTVWDTGIGIPAAKQHLIFQKFQQLENPLTRQFEGTGLGLVLTQRLARLHGGDVTFVSKEGEGSQFTLLLPPNPPGSAAGVLPPVPTITAVSAGERLPLLPDTRLPQGNEVLTRSTSQRSQLVLIVEAVPQRIEALSDQLTGLGYRVVIARSGTEALEKARRLQPCLIFLNPVLPLLSGWDVLTLLKANAATQQLPVAVMATKVDEEQARQRQADHLLSLPVQPQALQRCLQTLVRDRQAPAPPSSVPLTILQLSPGVWSNSQQPIPTAALKPLLHTAQCRILEADDLEQAELLARVWKPNVVLLDGVLADATAYFQQYGQHIVLASLPLVTIDPLTAQAANQVPGLLVFPCLSTPEALLPANQPVTTTITSALMQVIQIAAGYAWRSSVLALDASTLPLALPLPSNGSNAPSTPARALDSLPHETEWLQALMQYLNTAGFRGMVGRCWQEVLQQLDCQSVDVLVICWTDAIAQPFTLSMLSALQALHNRPPILVLDHRRHRQIAPQTDFAPLPEALQQIATQILPASLPMTALLQQLHQVMKISQRPDR